MANSKFEYVRGFEAEQILLPDTFIVVRIDGRGFTKFCQNHDLLRPIDDRLVNLMVSCGKAVMEDFSDMVISYGQSDEFSFVFRRDSNTFNRRHDKIVTTVVSLFASTFVYNWQKYFPTVKLQQPPAFDARIILYPRLKILQDYLSWRQADAHINCLYNYTLCVVMQSGISGPDATEKLRGTFTEDKNEILFHYGVNYAFVPASHRKGTILLRDGSVVESNDDLISEAFWEKNKRLFK